MLSRLKSRSIDQTFKRSTPSPLILQILRSDCKRARISNHRTSEIHIQYSWVSITTNTFRPHLLINRSMDRNTSCASHGSLDCNLQKHQHLTSRSFRIVSRLTVLLALSDQNACTKYLKLVPGFNAVVATALTSDRRTCHPGVPPLPQSW